MTGFTSVLDSLPESAVSTATDSISSITSKVTGFDPTVSILAKGAENANARMRDATAKNNASGETSDYHKRLQVIRSRAARSIYRKGGGGGAYVTDRGPITSMRLLKNPDYDIISDTRGKTGKVDIQSDIQNLLSGSGFANFFLTNIQTNYSEKTQIMTTFGDNEVVYYFGKQPVIFNLTGLLFDSIENEWFVNFLTLYQTVIRGTQLAKNFGLVEITFPNMIVTGSISSLSTQQDASRDTDIVFNMQFIAKNISPLPVNINSGVPDPTVSGKFLDFAAARSGVKKYTLGSGTLGQGFMSPLTKTVTDAISEVSESITDALSPLASAAGEAGDSLNEIRTSIFSPVAGILSSITKILKSPAGPGSITSIVSSLTSPVNELLGDISNIAAQASGIANLVQSSIISLTSGPGQIRTNIRNTIAALKGAAGTITRLPKSISDDFRSYNTGGQISRKSYILSSGKSGNVSKAAVLSSGSTYNPAKSNKL